VGGPAATAAAPRALADSIGVSGAAGRAGVGAGRGGAAGLSSAEGPEGGGVSGRMGEGVPVSAGAPPAWEVGEAAGGSGATGTGGS
jgi:hypothetical protein